ncbi:MMS19 nucleotide excision repair protein homolog isoform X2 [Anoplophora glabripennis]|nr:MMS19 nucleotide excision repair protein homolog isoform X2 [Anoplophora glabripennis]
MEVLQNVPYDFLNIQQLKMISGFYIEKLNDHHQILPVVLQGILRLIKFKYFPEEAIHSILNTIFLNVACQQQQQSDRYVIYQIFQLSLEKYKEALISMKLDLVYGVISSIDGERDPRNLMFLFKWLKSFLTTIPLGHLTEEMFEVIACYFPVDFKTPPSIGRDITREDLANELSPCLCAIPEFSEYCIPLALEKLESSLQIAKLDSLNLLRKGCNVFSSTSYLTYATEIWSLLQKEVFSNVDDSVKRECLNTLTTVINKISLSEKGHFISFLNNITTTLRGNLLPDSKLFQPSISILLHTAMGSQESSVYIVKEIVPILTNTYIISHDPTQKAVLLRTLLQFVKTHLKYNSEKIFINNDHLDTVPLLCLKASTEIESNLCSAGFESLADLAEMLSLNVRLSLYKHLHDVIIKPASIEIREAMLNCLKNISFFYPAEVNEFVLYKSKITDPSVLNLYLDALCVIADLEHFREIVTDCFISYAVEDLELAIVAVKNTRNLLQRECNNMNLINKFIQKEIINKFIATKIHCNNDLSFEFLMHISSVLKILIGSLDSELQNQILSCQINVISSYEHSEELYLLLLDGLISRVRNGLSPDSRMLAFLTKISVIHGNTSIRDISVQLLANIINKHPNGDGLVISLDNIKQDCLYYFSTHKSNVIITLSWITKALVMRNHSTAKLWSDMLLLYLEQDDTVAKGFKIIMNDSYDSLSPVSYCKKMLLYQQKFFVLVTNKLCANFSPEKKSYLIATGYLIECVSEQALLLQFKKILKLVILCLEECNDPEVLCNILRRLKSFIVNNESILQENLEDFLSRILKLTIYEHSMNVRVAALQCLIHFSALPLYRILPFKQKVLYHLESCIDDKKRLVRKEAMEARALWFLLDAPI